MKVLKKQLTLPKTEYFIKHLSIVNIFLPVTLTPKEIEVIAAFMSLEGDIAEQRFGTSARKMVREQLNLSPGGLGNYLNSLKQKRFLAEKDGSFSILPILHPDVVQQNYVFQLNKNG